MINIQKLFNEQISYPLLSSSFFIFLVLSRCSLDPLLDKTRVFGGMGLGAILNLILILYGLITFLKSSDKLPVFLFKAWGFFLAIGIFSIALSPIKFQAFRSFISVITYFVIFALPFFMVKTKSDIRFLLKVILASAAIPYFWAIIETIITFSLGEFQEFRVLGSFSHPNIFAFYLVLVITLSFYVIKTEVFSFSLRVKRYCFYLILLGAFLLLLTKTRSAWLALLIIIFCYGLLCEKKYLIFGCFAILLALLIPAVQDRILDVFSGADIEAAVNQGYGKLNSFAWRKLVWASSWNMIMESPLIGYGYNTFSYYFLSFFPLGSDTGFDAHNMYVQLIFDMGFLGLTGFIILLINIFSRLFKYTRVDHRGGVLLVSLLFSFSISGYSDNMLFYLSYNWYLWLVLGLFSFLSIRHDILFEDNY